VNGPTTAPILGALGAALLFAFANNLQRGEASKVPREDGGPVRLLLRLLRTPRWLAGSAAAVLALLLQAWALRLGGVILVQAVIASTLVFSLVLESLLDRRLPTGGAIGGAALVVAGITLLVQLGRPGAGGEFETWGRAVASWAVVAVAGGGALLLARRRPRGRRTAVVLGAAAGICFAVDAVFLRGLAGAFSPLLPVTLVINVAGFVMASVLGNLVIQRAFQMAPLRQVLPAMAAAEPLTAVLVGRFLFDERLQSGLVGTLAVWGGLGLMIVGVVLCALGQVRPAVPPSRVGGAP
jgi:drug/metabolite transporter (DMT)-like permease